MWEWRDGCVCHLIILGACAGRISCLRFINNCFLLVTLSVNNPESQTVSTALLPALFTGTIYTLSQTIRMFRAIISLLSLLLDSVRFRREVSFYPREVHLTNKLQGVWTKGLPPPLLRQVEELYDAYCIQRRLRDGASKMVAAFNSATGSKEARESLSEANKGYRECTEVSVWTHTHTLWLRL